MAEAAALAGATNTEAGGDKPATAATALTEGGEQKTAEQLAADAASKETDPAKKAADEQAAKAKAEADAKAANVPDKYDLKLPDGTIVDQPMMDEFTQWAKENKFTAEQAQKAADLHLKSVGAFARQMAEAHDAELETWHEEIVNDKDLGGAKLDASMTQARKLMAVAATVPGVNAKRLSDDLARTGMTTHPDMIRLFHHLGQFIGEDNKFISGNASAGAPKDMAESWYGPDGVKKP